MVTGSYKLRLLLLIASLALITSGCVGAQATHSPLPTIGPCRDCVSPGPSSDPSSGFYLRIWQSQAILPQYTFGVLPGATISGGQFIDGMIAIPMIYPGPIYSGLSSRAISPAGIATIIAFAQDQGMLDGRTDFTQVPTPGSVTAHISLVVNSTSYELSGPLPGATPESIVTTGSTGAFEGFFSRLQTILTWLASDLGPSVPYNPTKVAFELSPPADAPAPMNPTMVAWPLSGTFADFGVVAGADRCAVLSGADLATLLPVVENANQLTRFVDSAGVAMSLAARPLLPGEPNIC